MKIKLLNGESMSIPSKSIENMLDEDGINIKYEEGHNRIVTEQGAYKLTLLKSLFDQENYKLKPKFQRRITWDNKKKSKLIESFIINIPIPPVFIYEHEFDKYEVMDGLQRISAIISFYGDEFQLEGLEEWPELNGKKYSELPEKIREGIDRRQLSVITLLKESAQSKAKGEAMKKMVFERLNTGGVKLSEHEIRNALYDGRFNEMCIELSRNEIFRRLWRIKECDIIDEADIEESEEAVLFATDKLYKRMYDIEIVLRFFAMRHIDELKGSLSAFLDRCLISGNSYKKGTLEELKKIFEETIVNVDKIFGKEAFCQYKKVGVREIWSNPQRTVYDPLMLVVSQYNAKLKILEENKKDENIKLLKSMYMKNQEEFNGKKQSKADIETRYVIIEKLIINILGS